MKTKKIIYIVGAVICSALNITFRAVALPVALAYDALDAMANTSDEATDSLMAKVNATDNDNTPEA